MATRPSPWLLAGLLAAILALTLLAPEEKTLAAGIRPVYVHVGLTWAGMVLLLAAGGTGLALAFAPHHALERWQARLYLVGMAFFALGLVISLAAAQMNWGGIPFREPRFLTALNVLVIGSLAAGLARLASNPRLSGLARALPALVLFLSLRGQSFGLHPQSPVSSAPPAIKLTFYAMFILMLACSGWWLWRLAKPA